MVADVIDCNAQEYRNSYHPYHKTPRTNSMNPENGWKEELVHKDNAHRGYGLDNQPRSSAKRLAANK